jgi:extracellular solute-binding protein (family 5)
MPRFSRRGPGLAAAFGSALLLSWLVGACVPARAPAASPAPQTPAAPELPAAASPPAPAPDECLFRPPGPPGVDTIRVLAATAFVSRQLYETLIRLDCAGRPRPGLADSWTSPDGGRTWGFALRPARFWDGTAVTAEAIATGWTRDSVAAGLLRRAGILFVTAGGDGELRMLLDVRYDSIPAVLADPRLALARRSPDLPWPIGTGPYRLPEVDPAPATLEAGDAGRPVRLLPAPRDLRDAVDAGADLIVTDDPAALAYAAARPEVVSLALPWSRTYVLVLDVPLESAAAAVTAGFRESLARDVVRVDARAAAPTMGAPACPARPPGGSHPRPAIARIAYLGADRTARDLAARLVAVGVGRAIIPLDSITLVASLRDGAETGYVLPLPRTLLSCGDLELPAGATVLPLVETRAHAIIRRGAPPMTVDWDGTLRLLPEAP